MRINFDFTDLEAFLAVKEAGSFHSAAERLGLSQSSVTRRIAKLEETLGTTLFERTTREVRATLAAKRLQSRAEIILNEAQETARAMRDETIAYEHQRSQTITLAAVPTIVSSLVVPAIRVFLKSHPKVRLRLLDLAANEVAEAVAQSEADIGLCSIPMLEPVTEFEPVFSDTIALAMPADHPLAEREALAWNDLESHSLILPARGTGNRLLIDEAMAHANISIRWTLEVGRSATTLDLVSEGVGIAPLPLSTLQSNMLRNIVHRPIRDPEITRMIGLLTRNGHRDNAAIRTLAAAIRDAARPLGQGAAPRP